MTAKIKSALWWAIIVGAVGGVALLFINVVLDVFLRYSVGTSIRATTEMVANWWMIAIVFFGLGLAHRDDSEIRVDMIVDALPVGLRRAIDSIALLVVVGVTSALAYATTGRAIEQMHAGEYAAVGIVIWPARFLVPFGLATTAVVAVVKLVNLWHARSGSQPTGK